MSFARQKRLLVGVLALLAPIPLPFNDIVPWVVLVAYLALVGWFLRRAAAGAERWLPNWAMNLLAIAYVPLFALDITVLSRGRMVGPVVHLLMFVVLAKLFALVRERDKWQTLVGVLFLFLASMATSVHLSVLLYLAGFIAVVLLLLTRFAFLHILTTYGHRDPAPALLPLGRFLTFATIASLLVAVPFFLLLPRIRAPYIVGRGTGIGSGSESVGFSDEVTCSKPPPGPFGQAWATRKATSKPSVPGRPGP